jgi:hypothetical protein
MFLLRVVAHNPCIKVYGLKLFSMSSWFISLCSNSWLIVMSVEVALLNSEISDINCLRNAGTKRVTSGWDRFAEVEFSLKASRSNSQIEVCGKAYISSRGLVSYILVLAGIGMSVSLRMWVIGVRLPIKLFVCVIGFMVGEGISTADVIFVDWISYYVDAIGDFSG